MKLFKSSQSYTLGEMLAEEATPECSYYQASRLLSAVLNPPGLL